MKKLLLLLILFCGVSFWTLAADRSEEEMYSIASVRLYGANAKGNSSLGLKKVYASDYCSIYGDEDQGLVIVSKNEAFSPVIAYSSDHNFSSTMPCGMKWWLGTVEATMKYYIDNGITSEIDANGPNLRKSIAQSVAPFIKTTWNQYAPYNNLCPIVSGERFPSGCVATALAQCMNFFKYPTKGTGSGKATYYNAKGTKSTLSVLFSLDTFDWGNMSDSYSSSSSMAQTNAVARLVYDCGVASCMQYASGGSSASEIDAGIAMIKNFCYDTCSVSFYLRPLYSDEEWKDLLYSELSKGYPILYSGNDASAGGHSFVVDGYDANGLVHVNWGWGGSDDGYYDFNLLNPEKYSFNLAQTMVMGMRIKSEDTIRHSQWYLDSLTNVEKISSDVLSFGCNSISSISLGDFYGNFGIVLQKGDEYTVLDSLSGRVETFYGFNQLVDTISDISKVPVGTYKLMFAVKGLKEAVWQPVLYPNGSLGVYTLVKTADDFKLIADNGSVADGISSAVARATDNYNMVRVYNVAGQQIYSSPSSSFNERDIKGKGVMIIKRGSSVSKIYRK